MKLKKLIAKIPNIVVKGSKDVEISGISTNSKKVCPKNIFFALKGKESDGSDYIYEAVSNGASAIVTNFYDPFLKNIVQVITDNPYEMLILFAKTFYQSPSSKLYLVGITGTNGKTTTSFLIKHIIEKENKKTGLIGTCDYHVGSSIYPSSFTTPLIETTTKFLKEMVDAGCEYAIMEASSHGLKQRRCETLDFDAAIFTNLTEEHLDYHRDIYDYADAKKKLFELLKKSSKEKKIAVLNGDCIWHKHMISNIDVNIITYGIENKSDVMASDIKLSSSGSEFIISYKKITEKFNTKLVGKFNVYNVLAAISYGLFIGISLQALAVYLSDFRNVRGRMEKVETQTCKVFVDFAHTPNALENCLKTLSEIKTRRIITVFGCGGNRDAIKRPIMGKIAEKYSDKVILTNDNPRRESPEKIVEEIIAGFKSKSSYDVILDRRKAIAFAIEISDKEDIVLIAGKGHETKQIFANKVVDFDDIEIVKTTVGICV